MSGGRRQYVGVPIRNGLEAIAEDAEVRARWPRVATLCAALASALYNAEREMDPDLNRVIRSILEPVQERASTPSP